MTEVQHKPHLKNDSFLTDTVLLCQVPETDLGLCLKRFLADGPPRTGVWPPGALLDDPRAAPPLWDSARAVSGRRAAAPSPVHRTGHDQHDRGPTSGRGGEPLMDSQLLSLEALGSPDSCQRGQNSSPCLRSAGPHGLSCPARPGEGALDLRHPGLFSFALFRVRLWLCWETWTLSS